MADTFDSRLKLRLQESGGNSGQWGTLLNQTVTNIASVFGYGTHQLTSDADATLTLSDDGASIDALKSSYLKITSSVSLSATRTLTFAPNTFNQVKYIENATTGGQSLTISQGSGANITIESGATKVVYFDGAGSGAAVVDALANIDQGTAEFDTIKVATIQANDGTGSATIANSTGVMTIASSVLTTTDINGGTIDNAAIGSSTPAAGSFTTFTSNGIDDNANATAVTINSDEDVLIGTATRSADTQVFTKSLTVKGTYDGTLELETGRSDGDNSGVGRMVFVMPTNNASARDVAQIASETDGSTANERGGSLIFSTKADNVDGVVQRLNINSGGDIAFHDGSGNAGFFWDASAERLGLGTTSPQRPFHLNIGTDNTAARFESSDTEVALEFIDSAGTAYFRGSGGYIKMGPTTSDILTVLSSGIDVTGQVKATSDFIAADSGGTARGYLFGTSSGLFARFNSGGTFQVQESGSTKLTVNSTGIDVTGTVTADGLTVDGGTSNVATTFKSTDATVGIKLEDNTGNVELSATGNVFNVQPAGGSAILTASSTGVGIGVIPETHHSGVSALQVGLAASLVGHKTNPSRTYLNANSYINSSNVESYVSTDEASQYFQNAGTHTFKVAPSGSADSAISWNTAMTIDNSANVLVGTTNANPTSSSVNDAGVELSDTGGVRSTVASNPAATFNRKTDDGDIVLFRKDGSTVGSIASTDGTDLQIGSGNCYLRFDDATNQILPTNAAGTKRDATIDLGDSDARFDDIFATNGTIQTSDRNEKQDIAELSDAEQRVAVAAKGLLRKFRWKSSVEEKGDDARIHFGIIAQDLQDAFTAEGLDAGRYAMFISSTWTDEETGEERTRLGVRYSELLAFIISAI